MPAKKKPITFSAIYGPDRANFSGQPARGFAWLDDGEHYRQRKGGGTYKVHARTGRNELISENSAVVPEAGSQLYNGEKHIGEVRSCVFSPTLQHWIALVYLDKDHRIAVDGNDVDLAIDVPSLALNQKIPVSAEKTGIF